MLFKKTKNIYYCLNKCQMKKINDYKNRQFGVYNKSFIHRITNSTSYSGVISSVIFFNIDLLLENV